MTIEPAPSQKKTSSAEVMKRASLIFIGTVAKMEAVSFSGVRASRNTAVVNVDRIIEKPKAVSLAEGKQITVELKDPSPFHEGIRATFYAEGWVLGEGVAVKETGHELIATIAAAQPQGAEEKRVQKARQDKKDADVRARIANADMVAVGRVTSVRPLATAAPARKPITEHDPDWQEATIKVDSGLKGIQSGKEVIVRFPASEDVAHYGAPKFTLNQEGVFFLKKDKVTGRPKALLGGAQVDAYVVQDQRDVLPKEESARVRTLMKSR
jgi:hypothetical protein